MDTTHLIIFDCDGTLVDSEILVNRYFVDRVNRLGINLTYEEAWANFPGTSLRLCMDYVEDKFAVKLPDDFVENYRLGQKSLFANHLKPIPGAKECLQALTSFDLCVASNGPLQIIEDNLTTTALRPFFGEHLFSAYELGIWKPDPSLFLHAASTMRYSYDRCIVIEDSAAGIAAGVAANMQVFAYQATNLAHHPNVPQGVTAFSDLSTLPALIAESI